MKGKLESDVIDYLVDRKFKRAGDAPFPSFKQWRDRRKTQGATLERFLEPEDAAAYRLELERMSLRALDERLEKVAEQEAFEHNGKERNLKIVPGSSANQRPTPISIIGERCPAGRLMRQRRFHFVRLQSSSLGTRSRFTLGNPPSLTAMRSAGISCFARRRRPI